MNNLIINRPEPPTSDALTFNVSPWEGVVNPRMTVTLPHFTVPAGSTRRKRARLHRLHNRVRRYLRWLLSRERRGLGHTFDAPLHVTHLATATVSRYEE